MRPSTGSILYVTESPEVNEPAWAMAQAFALQRQLPFAVVYCLEDSELDTQLQQLKLFRELETFLVQYSIPLIILLGERDTVLPWMSGHVKPERIFTHSDVASEGSLQKHPIPWPGRVMTIPELQALVSGDQTYCRPS